MNPVSLSDNTIFQDISICASCSEREQVRLLASRDLSGGKSKRMSFVGEGFKPSLRENWLGLSLPLAAAEGGARCSVLPAIENFLNLPERFSP
jgi:hypothetical protein